MCKYIIGTDEEKALKKAIKLAFLFAQQTVCLRHLKNNVNNYLKDKVGLSYANRKDLIYKILGLASSDNSITLEKQTDELKVYIEYYAPKFTFYFEKRILPHLGDNQLGSPDIDWTNNNCESMNHVLKILTDWKQKNLLDLVDVIYEHVCAQYKDIE